MAGVRQAGAEGAHPGERSDNFGRGSEARLFDVGHCKVTAGGHLR